jgi:hypothetical protein
MKNIRKSMLLLAILSILLSACNAQATAAPEPTVDLNAYSTEVARTVLANITATAAAWTPTPEPPTNTPEPTATLTPEATATSAVCTQNLVQWVADITYPDGTSIAPNTEFVKTWRVQNIGNCTWTTSYKLVFSYAVNETPANWKTATLTLPQEVKPGETVDLSITLKTPDKAGTYGGAWGMLTDLGVDFPEVLTIQIVVP